MENGSINKYYSQIILKYRKHPMSLCKSLNFNKNQDKRSRLLFLSLSGISLLFFNQTLALASPKSTISIVNESPKEVVDQVWQIVYRDYLDYSGDYTRDEWLKLRREILSRKYIDVPDSYEAIREMLSSLNDPYTRFLDPKEFSEMRIDTTGELSGVGIQLSIDKETNELVVISPIEGTPAFNAGVKPKDVIISIDNKSTEGMKIESAVKLIRGKKGTQVTLGLLRNGKRIKVSLVRARIEIHVVESKLKETISGFKIGYIRLRQFNANAAKEMRNAIKKLEGENALGYVLDLRKNPGGLLESSIEIARQWLDEGIIVSTQTRDGIKDVRKANGRALTDRPVVVLVDEGSASASEILSGAIKDNNRGILVGKKTFGKGLVQSVRSLADNSGLIVTVAKYLTPSGIDIHTNGIEPDIESEISKLEARSLTRDKLGTLYDSQYMTAETALVKVLRKLSLSNTFVPGSSNLFFALKK